MQCLSRAVLLAVGLIASLATAAHADGALRARLTDAAQAFEQAALRTQDSDDKPRAVVRWDQPIIYGARNAYASPSIERDAFDAVQRIAGIAGIAVRPASGDDPTLNFTVILTDNEAPAVAGNAGSRTCFARSWWQAGRMTRVELNLNFANIRRMQRCVVHEALHGFGFNSHPHGGDSVLSYVHGRNDLTALDRWMIETLYDKRLRPALPRAQAAPLACQVLGEKMQVPAADIDAVCPLRR